MTFESSVNSRVMLGFQKMLKLAQFVFVSYINYLNLLHMMSDVIKQNVLL